MLNYSSFETCSMSDFGTELKLSTS